MAQPNDPTKPFADATQAYQARLTYLWKSVFKKLGLRLKPMIAFVGNLITNGAQIVGKIGKVVFKTIQTGFAVIVRLLDLIPSLIKRTLRFGKKILDLLAKALDPVTVIKALKTLFTRYLKMVREIFDYVTEFFNELDVLGKALSVANSFKTVLRLIFSWFADVTRALDAVKKARKLLRKLVKEIKLELKQMLKLRKEVMRLKPAEA